MIKTYEIPRFTSDFTEESYLKSLQMVLECNELSYNDFVPTKEDKKLYDINLKVDCLYKNDNLRKLTNDFRGQILKITDAIFSPYGEIKEDFSFIRISATENDGHGHVVIAKKEFDDNGEPFVSFKIVENEMKTLNTVDGDSTKLLLAKNAYFELNFEYKEIQLKTKKQSWFSKITNQNTFQTPEIPEYELQNFYATKVVLDKLDLFIADLAFYNPIESLIHGKFYDKMNTIKNKNASVMIIQREYRFLMKELRMRSIKSNHKNPTQFSSQHSDQP
jgi:hypothetical protein